jgi:DNA (cytosine-5)-methyltransferase 1
MYPLLDMAESGARDRLAASGLGRMLPGEAVVDLFCGGGGWGAAGVAMGLRTDFAVNHSPTAIAIHGANHPWCTHHQGDAWRTRPRDVVGRREVGLLLASAACTTHSRARGAAPTSKRVHMLGWCIARWIKDTAPRMVLVENVVEWLDWGPMIPMTDERGREMRGEDGKVLMRPDPARKGQHFKRWVRQCQRLGYQVEWRTMDAADFGEASRRKRLFVQMRRDGAPIVWPERTHGNGLGLTPYRAAADVIDWRDLGTSIFARKRRLKPKTLARIAEGVRRFVLNDPAPFVIRTTHGHAAGGCWHVSSADAIMPTQTTRQDLAVATPVFQALRGNAAPRSPEDHLPTITAGNGPGRGAGAAHAIGMIVPVIAPQNTDVYGRRADEPGPTITTKGHQSLITPVLSPCGGPKRQPDRVDANLQTILTREDRGIATPVLATVGYGERDGQRPRCHGIGEPMGTVVGNAKQGLVAPVLAYANQGGTQTSRADVPARTVVAGGLHAGVAVPMLTEYYGNAAGCRAMNDTLGAVVTHDRHGVVTPILADASERARDVGTMLKEQLGSKVTVNAEGMVEVTIGGAVYVIVDILFRMLRVPELAAAMGFPPAYIWPTSQRDAVKLIGNAISVRNGRALLSAMLPEHEVGEVQAA